MTVGTVALQLEQLWGQEQAHRFVVGASLSLWKDGRRIGTLTPRQNFYPSRETPMPTPAVRSRASGDLYVSLMAFATDGSSATVRVLREPLVAWIWAGGGLIVLGVAVVLWPRWRRRRALQPAARPAAPPVRARQGVAVAATAYDARAGARRVPT